MTRNEKIAVAEAALNDGMSNCLSRSLAEIVVDAIEEARRADSARARKALNPNQLKMVDL